MCVELCMYMYMTCFNNVSFFRTSYPKRVSDFSRIKLAKRSMTNLLLDILIFFCFHSLSSDDFFFTLLHFLRIWRKKCLQILFEKSKLKSHRFFLFSRYVCFFFCHCDDVVQLVWKFEEGSELVVFLLSLSLSLVHIKMVAYMIFTSLPLTFKGIRWTLKHWNFLIKCFQLISSYFCTLDWFQCIIFMKKWRK